MDGNDSRLRRLRVSKSRGLRLRQISKVVQRAGLRTTRSRSQADERILLGIKSLRMNNAKLRPQPSSSIPQREAHGGGAPHAQGASKAQDTATEASTPPGRNATWRTPAVCPRSTPSGLKPAALHTRTVRSLEAVTCLGWDGMGWDGEDEPSAERGWTLVYIRAHSRATSMCI
eukprot:CAMPEP_0114309866 /NCGR_PEP_ID=MMETSP0059-20121206/18898_1 /TAXON_ID=36894 /ORGANISM="Pyramimonas parkeae, Strain CCMP726" /LENGTH=172 /DNA_ID=CAMNT_0001433759 /DNA_START=216 /DNA_END=735 /DNA_ORIENTATION=+